MWNSFIRVGSKVKLTKKKVKNNKTLLFSQRRNGKRLEKRNVRNLTPYCFYRSVSITHFVTHSTFIFLDSVSSSINCRHVSMYKGSCNTTSVWTYIHSKSFSVLSRQVDFVLEKELTVKTLFNTVQYYTLFSLYPPVK